MGSIGSRIGTQLKGRSPHTHVYVSMLFSRFFLPSPPLAVSTRTSSWSRRSVVSDSFSRLVKNRSRTSYLINDTSLSSPLLLPERTGEMCMVLLESFCPPPFLSPWLYDICVISDLGVCRQRLLRAGVKQTEAAPGPWKLSRG